MKLLLACTIALSLSACGGDENVTNITQGITIKSVVTCVKILELPAIQALGLDRPTTTLFFMYRVSQFNENVISIDTMVSDYERSYHASVIRSISQVSYATQESQAIAYDAAGTANAGLWVFSNVAGIRQASYTDQDVAGARVVTYEASECETVTY